MCIKTKLEMRKKTNLILFNLEKKVFFIKTEQHTLKNFIKTVNELQTSFRFDYLSGIFLLRDVYKVHERSFRLRIPLYKTYYCSLNVRRIRILICTHTNQINMCIYI